MTRPSTDDDAAALFARRQAPIEDLAGQPTAVAATCHAMAVCFHQGGKLVVFGTGGKHRRPACGRWSLSTR